MDVDQVGLSDPPSAPSPSLKRQQENATDVDSASKRTKIIAGEPEGVQDAAEERECAPEPSGAAVVVEATGAAPLGTNEEGDRAGGGKKKRNRNISRKDFKESRRGKRRGTRDEAEGQPSSGEAKAPRLPKRPAALLLGFCGDGFNGMQIQGTGDAASGVRTIEGVLFNALIKVGAVSQDNSDNPSKVALGRAARTDAGVHAAGNVVSMKLITEIPGVPNLVEKINEELPPEIRLWNIIRVQSSFNARTFCDSRKYTYFFPSYLMIPPKPKSGLHKSLIEQNSDYSTHSFWESAPSDSTPRDDLARKRAYRVTPEQIAVLRETAKKFEGSHNFHNFTVQRDFKDRSCQRNMKSIEILDPAVYGDTEWIAVMLHGQSFMLHQRKMIAVLTLACRTGTPSQIIEEMYGPRQVSVPKMPALGLLLEYPIFDTYARKIAETVNAKAKPTDPEYRLPIDLEAHRERLDGFKEEFIYPRMRSIEDQFGIFDDWVRCIDAYAGRDFDWLNPKGVIPSTAVIKSTERRLNPYRGKKRFDLTLFPKDGQLPLEKDEADDDEGKVSLNKEELADMEG
ncbi:tRNA pseudouridine synthase [Epithele typhae]|uniref:tRNA pseudouridine synthase n=1 Tax=Epithele typhae TaxID=378194 RepID=UPI002007E5F8|nr:tRNA pseudouridine synthase [Epithele typhae]KAH9940804.1 tRNA pseudouridine synthase [Epithele typhae]